MTYGYTYSICAYLSIYILLYLCVFIYSLDLAVSLLGIYLKDMLAHV